MAQMTDRYALYVARFDATDPRLGRHIVHDSRSLRYRYRKTVTLVSRRHVSRIPTLDQGQLGSCTGNAATKVMSYDPLWNPGVQTVLSLTDASLDEQYAVGWYEAATAIDPWPGTYPPDDTGSDGLSVAKVGVERNLIAGYQHATDMNALLSALTVQPVIVGTEWRDDMFDPTSDGQIVATGDVAGGHEYVLDEIDVENRRVWIQNSWSDSWGINGRAWLSWEHMTDLMNHQGDCTIFTPLTAPAPTPTPANPQETFIAQAEAWVAARHSSKINVQFEKDVQSYLDWLATQ